GVHTGDSITVAPAQTLSDVEYQTMRDMARQVIRAIGVETGGSNIQFGVHPKTGRSGVIEMNPRVSRSSALASKATGFPIAKIAAKLAVGYTLDEITNDITRKTPACFEPTLDYVVVKIPKWQFEKFPGADESLGPQMKSVGEVMAIGRTFKQALLKGIRSLETGKRVGFSDARLVEWLNIRGGRASQEKIHQLRQRLNVTPVYKRVDTCAAEFESFTPYMYSTYEEEDEATPTDRKKVIILGSGPNRIGQGIEFDYCCCHAAFALRDDGFETIMVNCNPETVSTDYDTS